MIVFMKRLMFVPMAAALLVAPALLPQASQPFAGRWDLTITTPQATYPSWMEFSEKDGQPAVRLVGRVSSVHPGKDVRLDGSHLTFETSEWFGKPIKVTWEFQADAGKLTGTQKRADGVEGQITGVS